MNQWEYLTQFLEANKSATDSMNFAMEEEELASYSPQLLMPELNRLGAKGWELVHMEPVFVGKNEDILMHEGGGSRRWTNKYFCVFKRPA
ncbi:hypothetical protein [Candidatus Leptofilum sp.]|uniref:hypothetical protein n=1 Tax=Candidatus Leptofilum sp. TaxID=3241576 RepID=UPI003B5CE05F